MAAGKKKKQRNIEQIELKFQGENISPESFSLSEIGKILQTIEQLIVPIAANTSKKDFSLKLKSMQPGSLSLALSSSSEPIFKKVFLIIFDAIRRNDLTKIPYNSVQKLDELYRIIKTRKAFLSVFSKSGKSKLLGEINLKDEVNFSGYDNLRGATTVYGKVMWVGGKTPSVTIEIDTGHSFTCESPDSFLKFFTDNLYKNVILHGIAIWEPSTYHVKDFLIESVEPHNLRPIDEVLEEMREKFGKYYNDIDPEKYIKEMRK